MPPMRRGTVLRQKTGDDRPRLWKGQGVASSPLAFALDEGAEFVQWPQQ